MSDSTRLFNICTACGLRLKRVLCTADGEWKVIFMEGAHPHVGSGRSLDEALHAILNPLLGRRTGEQFPHHKNTLN